ncbi:MAG: hypothetical protein ABGZ17_23730 [Planctomycetaceae bacterium]
MILPHKVLYKTVTGGLTKKMQFTEKIIDSLLCHNLSVYWGDPDIEHFFDSRGMIQCRNKRALKKTIQSLTLADFGSRRPFQEENRRRQLQCENYPRRAVRRCFSRSIQTKSR